MNWILWHGAGAGLAAASVMTAADGHAGWAAGLMLIAGFFDYVSREAGR